MRGEEVGVSAIGDRSNRISNIRDMKQQNREDEDMKAGENEGSTGLRGWCWGVQGKEGTWVGPVPTDIEFTSSPTAFSSNAPTFLRDAHPYIRATMERQAAYIPSRNI